MSFRHSTIDHCTIKHKATGEEISTGKKNFKHVLIDVFATMPIPLLCQVTNFNLSKKYDMHGEKGYYWNEQLGLSIQGKDATATMREIVRLVELNEYSLDIVLKLFDGSRVRISR